MTTLQITSKIQIDIEELLAGLAQLQTHDLEGVLSRANVILAQRKASNLPSVESDLLRAINQGLPSGVQARYNELSEKMHNNAISTSEHDELLALVEQVELKDAERLENLMKLARLRNIPLPTLMEQLNISAPPVHG